MSIVICKKITNGKIALIDNFFTNAKYIFFILAKKRTRTFVSASRAFIYCPHDITAL